MATATEEKTKVEPSAEAPPSVPEKPLPRVLPGQSVWYWMVKNDKLTPVPATLLETLRTATGKWILNRHSPGVVLRCEGMQSAKPEVGKFTVMDAKLLDGLK